jgi:predicted deacetylase
MSVLASLHDVTPAHAREAELAWTACARFGLCPALFVVPDWHGRSPIEGDASFVRWLHERVAEGAEVFLHGERHDEHGARRGWRDHLRAFGRTDGEGEFLTLGEDEARLKIELGLARLRALGFAPIGFVPPAWLARDACWRAARAAGLALGEDQRAVLRLAAGTRVRTPVWRWSARTAARARISGVVSAVRCALQVSRPWVRVALHPADLRDRRTTSSLERALATLSERHRAARYSELLAGGAGSAEDRS